MVLPSFSALVDDFDALDGWEERYRYLIDLGRRLPPFPQSQKTDENRVRGCASQVWLVAQGRDEEGRTVMQFSADSDAHIVRGLVAVALILLSGKPAQDIAAANMRESLRGLGLEQHLTAQRANGFAALLARMQELARRTL